MAQKNNIRSIRFSDELAELIDRQVGDTFTAKFENLITRCVWELPAKEAELARIEEQIREKRERYQELVREYNKLNSTIWDISYRASALKDTINQKLVDWGA